MTDPRQSPQLIPHRLMDDKQIHHPVVVEEAKRRSRDFTCGWPITSPHLPAR